MSNSEQAPAESASVESSLIEKTADFYDEWYSEEKAHWEDAPGKTVIVEALKRCGDPDQPQKMLDIACGTGSFLDRVSREVSGKWEMHGIDISAAAVEQGRKLYPGIHLSSGDASKLSMPDEMFDLVTCYGSWEHFLDPAAAIKDAARVTRPGGWVLAMLPTLGLYRTDRDDEGWYEDIGSAHSGRVQMQWNWYRHTWEKVFEDAGLSLLNDALARQCGANNAGVFYFGVRLT